MRWNFQHHSEHGDFKGNTLQFLYAEMPAALGAAAKFHLHVFVLQSEGKSFGIFPDTIISFSYVRKIRYSRKDQKGKVETQFTCTSTEN